MTRAIPIDIHDEINRVEYLLEAAYMAAANIDDCDHVNAIQHVLQIAKEGLLSVERQLEALDEQPARMVGGERGA